MVRWTQVFGVAPISLNRPAFQARPILYSCISLGDCDRRRRRTESCCRQLVDPLYNVSSESVLIHPLDQRCKIRWITRRKRFHFLKQLPEFFLLELSIKIQAKQVIAECDLWRHLELLRKAICRGEVIVFHGIIKQGSQRASSVRCYAAKSLERIACVLVLFRVFGTYLQRCQIELI